jgi:uncharacterized protein (DUF927 family)
MSAMLTKLDAVTSTTNDYLVNHEQSHLNLKQTISKITVMFVAMEETRILLTVKFNFSYPITFVRL